MKHRFGVMGLLVTIGLGTSAHLLGCGDKFLVTSRATRYQRPKNARAAEVLIYANPAGRLAAALQSPSIESALKHDGHRSTRVETPGELSTILAARHFDVVLADASDAAAVEGLLAGRLDAPVLLPFCSSTKDQKSHEPQTMLPCVSTASRERSLLEMIDLAVARHDENARKAQVRS